MRRQAMTWLGSCVLGSLGMACSGGSPGTPASPHTFSVTQQTVATPANLLPCTLINQGSVSYVESTQTLLTCNDGKWVPVTLPRGPTGATGPTGPTGPTGSTGLATLVTVVPLAAGAPQCPAGGQEVEVGSDANRNGTLDASEVQQTAYVCNGESAGSTGIGPCQVDADCDDQNVCTTDSCSSGQCAHAVAPAATVCRAANGECDQAETCNGSSTVCPADVYSTAVCRTSQGSCDPAESCTGRSTACPADTLDSAGTECAGAQSCAPASTCDGVSAACPAQQPTPAGTVCDPASTCLSAATCDGTSFACPARAVAPAGTACTASFACGASGTCSGTSTLCNVSVTCDEGQSASCSCGSLVTGFEVCNSTCDGFNACQRDSNDDFPSFAQATVEGGDPSVVHDCGGSREPTDNGWHTDLDPGITNSASCAAGQRIADLSTQLPAGRYHIEFDGQLQGGTAISVRAEIWVNGSNQIAKEIDLANGSTLGITLDTESLTLTDCSDVDLRVVFLSGSSYDFSVYDFTIY